MAVGTGFGRLRIQRKLCFRGRSDTGFGNRRRQKDLDVGKRAVACETEFVPFRIAVWALGVAVEKSESQCRFLVQVNTDSTFGTAKR